MNTQDKFRIAKKMIEMQSKDIFSCSEQSTFTKFSLAKKLLSNIEDIQNKSFLVIYNTELVISLIEDYNVDPNKVSFYCDHLSKAHAVNVFNIPKANIHYRKNLQKFLSGGGLNMKFDVIVGNPPYKNNLHLKILSKLSNNCDVLSFIQPSIPFLDRRDENKYKEELNNIQLPLASIQVVNSANAFPDAKIQSPVAITYFDKSHQNKSVRYENEMTKVSTNTQKPDLFTGLPGYSSLHDRFFNLEKSKSINSLKLKNKDALNKHSFYVSLPSLRGNVGDTNKFYKKCFFTYYSDKVIRVKNSTEITTNTKNFEFKTKQQAQNFIDYLNTKFARTILLLRKRDFHPKFHSTPIVDWNVKWSDDMLFTHFELSDQEIEFINTNEFI